jgi:hypothetical protein
MLTGLQLDTFTGLWQVFFSSLRRPAVPDADDVNKMTQARLGEDLIIAQVRQNAEPLKLTTDDLVRLKNAGVSDSVIKTPQDQGLAIQKSRREPFQLVAPLTVPGTSA